MVIIGLLLLGFNFAPDVHGRHDPVPPRASLGLPGCLRGIGGEEKLLREGLAAPVTSLPFEKDALKQAAKELM
jgi:hypothetical protein